jgi:hypothetical protein
MDGVLLLRVLLCAHLPLAAVWTRMSAVHRNEATLRCMRHC